MQSNSPFKQHGIEHLSVSSINQWISNPASYLFKLAGGNTTSPAMWRGSAVEAAIEKATQMDLYPDLKHIIKIGEDNFDNEYKKIKDGHLIDLEKIEKEKNTVKDYIANGLEHFRNLGKPTSYQKKITVQFDELEIPFIGYIDFEYGEVGNNHQIRDCKTSQYRLYHMKEAHSRQLSLYGKAIGLDDTELWIDNITRNYGVQSLRLEDPRPYLKQIIDTALGLRKFLSISSDLEELCQMIRPDFDDWRWGGQDVQQQAKKIWR